MQIAEIQLLGEKVIPEPAGLGVLMFIVLCIVKKVKFNCSGLD